MKVEITKTVKKIEEIDIELPYYYKHDLESEYSDSVIYGKIELNSSSSIQETEDRYGEKCYEIKKEEYSYIKNSGLASYFNEEYKSNKKEFEDVKLRCLSFFDKI